MLPGVLIAVRDLLMWVTSLCVVVKHHEWNILCVMWSWSRFPAALFYYVCYESAVILPLPDLPSQCPGDHYTFNQYRAVYLSPTRTSIVTCWIRSYGSCGWCQTDSCTGKREWGLAHAQWLEIWARTETEKEEWFLCATVFWAPSGFSSSSPPDLPVKL